MRIGIDIRNIGKNRTGDETVFLNLVRNLAIIDKKNRYFLFTDILDRNVLAEIKEKIGILGNSRFVLVPLKSSNKFVWNAWTLPNYLKKNPVDVYHTQYITPFFVSKKIKIVTHFHDASFRTYPEYISKSDLFFLRILIPLSLKRVDKIIAVSEFTKQEIIKYYSINSEKIEVVYNSISDDFLNTNFSPEELELIRKKYSLPRKFILYVGTFQPRKNIPTLINAFAEIRKQIPDRKLVLAGNKKSHNFDKRIEESILKNDIQNSVIFPGYISQKDLPQIYKLSEIFAFPSWYEGFGIPILEALSQKIPVLCSKIPIHEEIAENAVLYFNPSQLDDFSKKLYNLIIDKNLREKLVNLGLQRLNFFSWKKSTEKILNVYQNLFFKK